jgi:hypothetical protein
VTDSFQYSPSGYITRGADTLYADAYGTLKLPGAIYTNALRVHIMESRWDTNWAFSGPQGPVNIHKENDYQWYVPGFHNSILSISFTSDSSSGESIPDTIIQFSSEYNVSNVNNINNQSNTITLYPNPTQNILTITSSSPITNIAITDLIGNTVYTHQYGSNQVQIDVAAFPTGIYFARINGTDMRKFVKE